ncbi:MAG: hypothetical protein ACLS37_05745 [Alistipes sp.]
MCSGSLTCSTKRPGCCRQSRLYGLRPGHERCAKALKSRLWLYAASPLFNGNSEYYANFVSRWTGAI